MEYLFWIIGLLLAHTFVIYPWTLKFLADIKGKKKSFDSDPETWPKVSILFSAYNEEGIILSKIENLKSLNYPKEKIEVLIGSDGSSDKTAELLKPYENDFQIFLFEQNRGKAAVLNELKHQATGEILIFCDANTFFLPNTIKVITLPFKDPKMSCVSGRLILKDTGKTSLGEGESLYWQVESRIKELEGQLDILMGVNGAIYAIRPEVYVPIPENRRITDDFYVSVHTLMKGQKCTYLRQAIGIENTSKSSMGEFHRKARISQANFNYLGRYIKLLNPIRPLVAYSFFSHKLLRWFSPHLMILLVMVNFFLIQHHAIYLIFLIAQLSFYLLALVGYLLEKKGDKHPLASLPFYFVAMNYALLLGFFHSLKPNQGGGWERIERDD